MRVFRSLCLALLVLTAIPAWTDWQKSADGYYHWSRIGGNPRVHGGLPTWDDFYQWWNSPGGQNDRGRLSRYVPQVVLTRMERAVAAAQNGEIDPDAVYEKLVVAGQKFYAVTFANGRTVGPVILDVSAKAYSVEAVDVQGKRWIIDTFIKCGNAGIEFALTQVRIPAKAVPVRPVEAKAEANAVAHGGQATLIAYTTPPQLGYTGMSGPTTETTQTQLVSFFLIDVPDVNIHNNISNVNTNTNVLQNLNENAISVNVASAAN